MKADKGKLGRALDNPDQNTRFYLFHGEDLSGSRALGDRLIKGLGAEKALLSGSAIRADVGLLPDEAGAISLFGGVRAIWIEPAGDEIAEAVATLFGLPAVESPVVAIAGALRKTSALLKLAEADPTSLTHASYLPEGREASRVASDLGRSVGLSFPEDVAQRVANAAGNDRAVMSQEMEKYALYLGASPEAPRELGNDIIDQLGADVGESDWLHLGDLALDGLVDQVASQLQRLPKGGSDAIPIIRALQRRVLQVASMRARVEAGERADGVMASVGRALFWKDKSLVQRLLSRWNAARLAQVTERVAGLERRFMLSPASGDDAVGEELIAIARAARR